MYHFLRRFLLGFVGGYAGILTFRWVHPFAALPGCLLGCLLGYYYPELARGVVYQLHTSSARAASVQRIFGKSVQHTLGKSVSLRLPLFSWAGERIASCRRWFGADPLHQAIVVQWMAGLTVALITFPIFALGPGRLWNGTAAAMEYQPHFSWSGFVATFHVLGFFATIAIAIGAYLTITILAVFSPLYFGEGKISWEIRMERRRILYAKQGWVATYFQDLVIMLLNLCYAAVLLVLAVAFCLVYWTGACVFFILPFAIVFGALKMTWCLSRRSDHWLGVIVTFFVVAASAALNRAGILGSGVWAVALTTAVIAGTASLVAYTVVGRVFWWRPGLKALASEPLSPKFVSVVSRFTALFSTFLNKLPDLVKAPAVRA